MKHKVPGNGVRRKRKLSDDYDHGEPQSLGGSVSKQGVELLPGERKEARQAHNLIMVGLRHYAEHGDSTKLARVIHGVANPDWREALRQWCWKYAQLPWDPRSNRFRATSPKSGVSLAVAEHKPFWTILRCEYVRHARAQVDPPGSEPSAKSKPCRVCGAQSIPGENTCYGHHPK